MSPKSSVRRLGLALLLVLSPAAAQTPPAAKTDPLGRDNPRSSVTGFLESCQEQNYQRAAQYLDLQHLPEQSRAARGPVLAKDLEDILNSDPQFAIFRLTRNPDGDPANDPDPNRQHVAAITQKGATVDLDLEHISLKAGSPPVWIFSADTVLAIPKLTPSSAPHAIARYLPPVLVNVRLLDTPLWKWAALLLAAMLLLSLGRLMDRVLTSAMRAGAKHYGKELQPAVAEIIIAPLRVIVTLALFRPVVAFVDPTAIARLYIGHTIELILVWAIAWLLIKIAGLFVDHAESVLYSRRHYASRSMLRLARRVANATIVVLAILTVLSNWGYNTSTLLAGLGVGGIAIALAAQQTIANVFGGVSIIGDQPVRIGDTGKFGDLTGEVEDIGMRSTRVRTLGRTVVSVPNATFAALNIENYTLRDKILFNPTLPIKRSTPDEQVRQIVPAIQQALEANKSVETHGTAVRLTSLTSAAFNLEIFCYVRTSDLNEFYQIQSDLLFAINQALRTANVELA